MQGRYWKSKELAVKIDTTPLSIPVSHAGDSVIAGAMLTLDAGELRELQLPAGEGVYLPARLATELRAQTGDTVRIQGVDVTLLGTFDPQRLSKMREIDGSPILPVMSNGICTDASAPT